ncbi:hypothetical protein D3P96_08265 [Weissella viridescens]|uniref:Uncharacterized protein n=1 Tax=Weissella viridescens TaxID=1629 RepID=A0A3P2REN4_WEIVI|nr:hypothetical protein [Weissella viridescens]RRG17330.1 hypothetical protein D3P96_08265 [Weissella viridescens]
MVDYFDEESIFLGLVELIFCVFSIVYLMKLKAFDLELEKYVDTSNPFRVMSYNNNQAWWFILGMFVITIVAVGIVALGFVHAYKGVVITYIGILCIVVTINGWILIKLFILIKNPILRSAIILILCGAGYMTYQTKN